jgi:putative N6-adenine-specific DNA methylase
MSSDRSLNNEGSVTTLPEISPEDFFLVVPIGLEESARKELVDWCAIFAMEFGGSAYLPKIEVVKGGIEFRVGEAVGLLLNACLKIPSRILQRVHQFSTREWPIVEQQLRATEWTRYFPHGIGEWEIAASESKMNNEKHLRVFLEQKFSGKFYRENPDGATAYLRVHNNQFTLSRDTSGEHLHFRGYRKLQGEAPLRENFAAFLWAFLHQYVSRIDLEKATIVDPFVGSGTLLVEAYLWNRLIKTRSFGSQNWISAKAQQQLGKVESRLCNWNLNLVGVDIEQDVIIKAEANVRNVLGTAIAMPTAVLPVQFSPFQFYVEDSTHKEKPSWLSSSRPVILLSNPPYGGKARMKSSVSWEQLWRSALERYQPEWAVALGPEKDCRKGDCWGQWRCLETHRFLNGGLRVVTSLWKNESR